MRKNDQEIPPEVLNIVQWIDLEKFDIHPATQPEPIGLTLRHINPLFGTVPVDETRLVGREQLAVPVAKNGRFPPG